MMLSFQDIEDVLFDGTEEQIVGLAEAAKDQPISYAYLEDENSFEMAVGASKTKMHGLFEVPNCVSVLGPSHSF